ncbi:MAG: hypothetical protein D6801_05290 [Alphaproteobacteria bacterium]|nr:MAG: hypothetical protein D6801_05290 [Alphaproteobacteria bacterium]
MLARLPGAMARALLVALLVLTPALILPETRPDSAQIILLMAVFAGVFTLLEYASASPTLVEFRDAPPFNRLRFLCLFLTVVTLSLIQAGPVTQSAPARLVTALGLVVGHALDFPYSPVRLAGLILPDTSVASIALLRASAGMAYLLSLLMLAVFAVWLRLRNWPLNRKHGFNVWINLPTFDPTGGGDVIERLERDARYNIALGFVLPFVTPPLLLLVSKLVGTITFSSPHTLIWSVTAWAFLPAGLIVRGMALLKVARLIAEQRERRAVLAGAPGAITA